MICLIIFIMTVCAQVDRVQLVNLLTNMAGIYIVYFIAGIVHEKIFKHAYINRITKKEEVCQDTMGLLLLPFLISWIMGYLYNRFSLAERVIIPAKNSALTALAVVVASAFSLFAIKKTSFPVVVMFESCSIVPVVLVGVFCSRVKDQKLKLGPKKIIVTAIITFGILLFEFFDPETRSRATEQEFIGILFLLFHFVAEGFLPDLQAQIKVNFKPQPSEMMEAINKWATILTAGLLLITLQAWHFLVFLWQHPSFTVDLISLSVLSGIGQFFVYRMIKQFKQHFVPFTITSRKILTVVISIFFFHHRTNWVQMLGVIIVLSAVVTEFFLQISAKSPPEQVAELNQEQPNSAKDQQQIEEQKDKKNEGGFQQFQEQMRKRGMESEGDGDMKYSMDSEGQAYPNQQQMGEFQNDQQQVN